MTNLEDHTDKMVTGCGFIRVFWSRLKEYRKADIPISQRQIFEEMNDHYERHFGEPRYPSYDAFKKFLRRHGPKC